MFIYKAYAAIDSGTEYGILRPDMEMWDLILTIISIFILIAGVLSILFILWWGLLLILSGGKEDKIKPAINTIRYAVLGIIVTVVTIFVFPIFWRLLGLDVEKYAEPKRIFERIEEMGNKLFGATPSGSSADIENLNLDDYSNL